LGYGVIHLAVWIFSKFWVFTITAHLTESRQIALAKYIPLYAGAIVEA